MRLATKVALAFVLDLSTLSSIEHRQKSQLKTHSAQPPSATLDVARIRQLDVRAPVPQPVDPELRQRDQELFGLAGGKLDIEDRMSDLFHDNRAR